MIAFAIISSLVTPPAIWLLILFKILPYKGETKVEAQLRHIRDTLNSTNFYLWLVWALFWTAVVVFIGF